MCRWGDNLSTYTLHLGDCLEYMRGMDAGSVDAVVTDPPYGMDYRPGKPFSGCRWDREFGEERIIGDKQEFNPSPFLGYKVVVLFGANFYCNKLPPSRGWVIWDKRGPFDPNDFSDCELIFTNRDCPLRIFRHHWRGVIRASENGVKHYHATQKPLALMKWLLEEYTQPGDTVFDPFMGSGTTGVACMQLGRNFLGCEIDPKYYAIAERRISQAAAQMILPFGQE